MSSLPLSRRPHPNGPATFFYSVDILVCRAFFPNPVSTLKMKRIPLAFHQKIGPEYIFFLFFFDNCIYQKKVDKLGSYLGGLGS